MLFHSVRRESSEIERSALFERGCACWRSCSFCTWLYVTLMDAMDGDDRLLSACRCPLTFRILSSVLTKAASRLACWSTVPRLCTEASAEVSGLGVYNQISQSHQQAQSIQYPPLSSDSPAYACMTWPLCLLALSFDIVVPAVGYQSGYRVLSSARRVR